MNQGIENGLKSFKRKEMISREEESESMIVIHGLVFLTRKT